MSKIADKNEKIKTLSQALEKDNITQLSLTKYFLETSLLLINELLENEVSSLAGERYSHNKPNNGRYSRWGSNPGSVRIGEEKVRIRVPRVFDNSEKSNKSLKSYKQLKEVDPDEEKLLKGILRGLSTNDYGEVVKDFTDSFGLSRSSVSKRFVERSKEAVKEFYERDLSYYNFTALFIDGKYLAKEQIIIVLGVTEQGNKIPLSFIQSNTENSRSIKELLQDLINRGFRYDDGLFCVIDGSKGIHKAITETFGKNAVIQRCQWHKRENVLSYLKESDKEIFKKKLNNAYAIEDYEEARYELENIIDELKVINIYASNSLKEGLEETLTINKLGLKADFGRSFSTTNIIENLNSQLVKYIRKVKRWQNSEQRQRWVASALLEVEQRMRRVDNFINLHIMRIATKNYVNNRNL